MLSYRLRSRPSVKIRVVRDSLDPVLQSDRPALHDYEARTSANIYGVRTVGGLNRLFIQKKNLHHCHLPFLKMSAHASSHCRRPHPSPATYPCALTHARELAPRAHPRWRRCTSRLQRPVIPPPQPSNGQSAQRLKSECLAPSQMLELGTTTLLAARAHRLGSFHYRNLFFAEGF